MIKAICTENKKHQQKANKTSFRSGHCVLEPLTWLSQGAHKLTAFFF